MIIYPLRLVDCQAVSVLSRQIFAENKSEQYSLQGLQSYLESEKIRAFTAQEEGQIIGYIIYRLLPPEAEIFSIAVCESARKRGVGQAFLSVCEQDAIAHKVERLLLEVGSENNIAIRFYRQSGFRIVARKENYYQNKIKPRDAFLMSKSI